MGVWSHLTPQASFASAPRQPARAGTAAELSHYHSQAQAVLEGQRGVRAEHNFEAGRSQTKETMTTSEDPAARENAGTIQKSASNDLCPKFNRKPVNHQSRP